MVSGICETIKHLVVSITGKKLQLMYQQDRSESTKIHCRPLNKVFYGSSRSDLALDSIRSLVFSLQIKLFL